MKKVFFVVAVFVNIIMNSCTDESLSEINEIEELSNKQIQFIEKDDFEEPDDRQS